MRESIGEWFTLNMIIIFIVIVFGLLSATISYYKAFKMNSSILYSIDKYEGYNSLSEAEIERKLQSFGYTINNGAECSNRGSLVSINKESASKYLYCVYYIANDATGGQTNGKFKEEGREEINKPLYYNYSVVTYIYVDLPIVGAFKVPVYTKGERIYNFTDGQYSDNDANYGK